MLKPYNADEINNLSKHDVKVADKKNWEYAELAKNRSITRNRASELVVGRFLWKKEYNPYAVYTYNHLEGHAVLSAISFDGYYVTDQCYRTPKLAKQLTNKEYKGFNYF